MSLCTSTSAIHITFFQICAKHIAKLTVVPCIEVMQIANCFAVKLSQNLLQHRKSSQDLSAANDTQSHARHFKVLLFKRLEILSVKAIITQEQIHGYVNVMDYKKHMFTLEQL